MEVYGNSVPTEKLYMERFRRFKNGNFSTEHKPRSRQPKKIEDKELEGFQNNWG